MRVRQHGLYPSLAGPAAEKSTLRERLHGAADLEVLERLSTEEFLEPRLHVAEVFVGEPHAATAGEQKYGGTDWGQSCQKIEQPSRRADQYGLADVGLCDEQAHQHRPKNERHRQRRHVAAFAGFREEPREDN